MPESWTGPLRRMAKASFKVFVPVRDLLKVNSDLTTVVHVLDSRKKFSKVAHIPAPMTRNFVPGGPGKEGCCPMVN